MYKKVNVVMLPTNEKAHFGDIILTPDTKNLLIFQHQNCTEVAQHLYITSNEEIKGGDWFLTDIRDNKFQNNGKPIYEVRKCTQIINGWILTEQDSELGLNPSWSKKIITTTDSSIELPQPSKEFIELYCKKYNEDTQIKEIFVKYVQELSIDSNRNLLETELLKINSDNTISIRDKINYSIEEVEEIIRKCAFYFITDPPSNSENILQVSNQWIKENL